MKKYIIISILIVSIIVILLFINIKRMPNTINKNIAEVDNYFNKNNITYEKVEIYDGVVEKGIIINQNIKSGTILNNKDKVIITVSLGKDFVKLYNEYNVNELGDVPIMMYHGIVNVPSNDTAYTGGNVDSSGYNRTAEAFREDLEFYYKNNYRMIPLKDYVDGIINVEIGKSPIVLTFDDGNKNNLLVNGIDTNGNIIIDPNCAVGILEEFKNKYPDFNVTATFFVNGGLFGQKEYNKNILSWLVKNGYDIGNHSYGHADFDAITIDKVPEQVGKIYQLIDSIIPGKQVNIMALPFGSPHNRSHSNFDAIKSGTFNNIVYQTKATLQVGWKSNVSPFSNSFDSYAIKRIRAYDNNGIAFDIQMNFKMLEKNRYISDGDKSKVVVKKESIDSVNKNNSLEVITY